MNRQEEILVFIHDNYSDEELPAGSGTIHEDFQEETDYEGNQTAFSQLLRKLTEKRGLLENPEYGKYTLSEKGRNKAEHLLNPEEDAAKKPEGYGELVRKLENFLDIEEREEVARKVQGKGHYTLKLSELDKYSSGLVDKFEQEPDTFMDALNEVAESCGPLPDESLKIQLEADVDYFKTGIFEAQSSGYEGRVLTVEGTVEYATKLQSELSSAVFECTQCGDLYEKEQDSPQVKSPYQCECGSRKFEIEDKQFEDVIEVNLIDTQQENTSLLCKVYPGRLNYDIDEKLFETFRPGRKINITGKVLLRKNSQNENRHEAQIEALSFENLEKNQQPGQIETEKKKQIQQKVEELQNEGRHPFDEFAKSLAPEIAGEHEIKKVVSAALIGGSPFKGNDGRIHVLIYSNPGIGKTGIHEHSSDTFHNCHLAECSNATTVGLVGTVENMEGGSYRIVAGKIVYADKGILCLDEIDQIDGEKAKRLNSAMQRGVIELDKATQHATLPAKATVIATGNYVDRLQSTDSEVREFMPDLASSVRDRFSLIYCRPPKTNQKATDAIIESFQSPDTQEYDNQTFSSEEQVVYRELARDIEPVVTEDAGAKLKQWIQKERSMGDGNFNRSEMKSESNRIVVNLLKLTTMFARSRLSEEATENDALKAIELFEMCRRSRGLSEGETDRDVEKQNKLEKVKKTIEELGGDDSPVEVQEVVKTVSLTEEQVEAAVRNLKTDMELFEPNKRSVQIL